MTAWRTGCPRCGGPLLTAPAESLVRCDRDCDFFEAEAHQLALDRARLGTVAGTETFERSLAPHERAILLACGAGDRVVARAAVTVGRRGGRLRRWYSAGIRREQLPGISSELRRPA